MTHQALASMRGSHSLKQRIVACVAMEGVANPDAAAEQFLWPIIARRDWISAWDAAVENYNNQYNPDTGARPDVITDAMILAAVQDVKSRQP